MDFSENVYTYYSPSEDVHLEYRLFWKGGGACRVIVWKIMNNFNLDIENELFLNGN